jgi:drug/metabolite transporter (DMT)-like permease
MDWFAAVDIYCERVGPGFWAEPFNALSNIAIPLAAIWAMAEARRRDTPAIIWLLIGMAALIGPGSFLFHTYANAWSELADTTPIWSFVALFIFVAIHRFGNVRPGKLVAIALAVAACLTLAFLANGEGAAPDGVQPQPGLLNGSEQYAPALLALLVFSLLTWRRRHPMRLWIWAATLTFIASLAMRTIDLRVCETFPTGTHFIWHSLNGLMIGILLQGLLRTTVPLRR